MKIFTLSRKNFLCAIAVMMLFIGEVQGTPNIVVDGLPEDWLDAGIEPLIIDPPGDETAGKDMLSLRVTDDGNHVYFLYEFVGTPEGSPRLWLDLDVDFNTGCQAFHVGGDHQIFFDAANIALSFIGKMRGCSLSNLDFPGALTAVVGNNFIEASVPINILETFNPTITVFNIGCSADLCDTARYPLVGRGAVLSDFDFVISQEIQIDLGPFAIAVGDFDKDGNLDLVVGHESSSTLSTLAGDSNGFFSLVSSSGIGSAVDFALGDFDEDGNLDLVKVRNSNDVSIALGNGDGSFRGGSQYPIQGLLGRGISLVSVATGDFNKDGHLDIVTSGAIEYSVAILFGDGAGNFSAPTYVIASIFGVPEGGVPGGTGFGVRGVGVGDFNEDGNLDIAASNHPENRAFVFFGNGQGLFSTPLNFESGASARALSVADVNKDTHADIIVAGSVSKNIDVLLGDGGGGFIRKTSSGLGVGGTATPIADFDQDGHVDIAAPDRFTGRIDVGSGDTRGIFTFTDKFIVGGNPRNAVSGDFNKDGFPDLAITDPGGGTGKISILLNSLVLKVDIDIKPGSFPNSINLGSGGTLAVAIFSTPTFDATTVSPTTVTLASAPVKLKGQGTPMASFEYVDGDNLLDLVMHISTKALQLSETDVEAFLEGETFGGTRIRGVDTVRVLP